ncbi:MAG: protein kinase, partial [Simkaniaceae bacterium]|nr:protein kinase [Simkaniaceae bacterium]
MANAVRASLLRALPAGDLESDLELIEKRDGGITSLIRRCGPLTNVMSNFERTAAQKREREARPLISRGLTVIVWLPERLGSVETAYLGGLFKDMVTGLRSQLSAEGVSDDLSLSLMRDARKADFFCGYLLAVRQGLTSPSFISRGIGKIEVPKIVNDYGQMILSGAPIRYEHLERARLGAVAKRSCDSQAWAEKFIVINGKDVRFENENVVNLLLSALKVKNIVKHLFTYISSGTSLGVFNANHIIATELYDADLFNVLVGDPLREKISTEAFLKMFEKIVLTVKELHSHGIMHGDIKLDNVFLKNGEPFLGDFDCAGEKGRFYSATNWSAPPELIGPSRDKIAHTIWNSSAALSPEMDVWALGCMLFAGFSREKYPFELELLKSEDVYDQGIVDEAWKYSLLEDEYYACEESEKYGEWVYKILSGCFKVDPEKRITLDALLDKLHSHPVFKDHPEASSDAT